jgi:hypothetical protein
MSVPNPSARSNDISLSSENCPQRLFISLDTLGYLTPTSLAALPWVRPSSLIRS